jgi:hypothetical protein
MGMEPAYHGMLCYAMLCYAMLCYATPWYQPHTYYLHASLADPKAMLRPRGSFLWREGVESKVGE